MMVMVTAVIPAMVMPMGMNMPPVIPAMAAYDPVGSRISWLDDTHFGRYTHTFRSSHRLHRSRNHGDCQASTQNWV